MGQIGLAFLSGHCLVHSLRQLPSWPFANLPFREVFLGLVMAFMLIGLLLLSLYWRIRWASALLLGIGSAWLHAELRLANDLASELEGRDLLVRGFIASLPTPTHLDPRFDIDVVDDGDARIPSRLRLAWYDTQARPAPGELWQLTVRLKRRSGFANPGGYDYEGQLFREGVGATGYVREDERNRRLTGPVSKYAVLRARAWIAQRMATVVTTDRYLGIFQGLAVGDTQAMQVDQWRVFAATGTTHLMAISGLHISMIAALAASCGGSVVWLRSAQRRRWTAVHGAAVLGAGAAVGYSCLAGLSVPTQRTLIMLCIYFAARWWRRDTDVANALGCALVGVLLVDPFAPLAAGAWLSFVAVAVIVCANAGRLANENLFREFTRMQLVVTIGMAPLVIVAFGGLSLVSPLANAVAIPMFTLLLVPLVLMGAAVGSFSLPAGGWILDRAAALLDLSWPALDWLAQRSLSVWYFPVLDPLVGIALAAGCTLLVVPSIWPIRLLSMLLCLPALSYRPTTPAAGTYELTLLDVGQGLAAVVRTHSHTLVYDTGPAFRTGRDTGELVVLPFLRSAGVSRIDMLMVSHGDLDHSGGMLSVLRGMATGVVVAGPSVQTRQVNVETVRCRAGEQWQWDGVAFDVLHPGAGGTDSDNNSSCVLRIAGTTGSALLTGDIEKQAEAALVALGLPQTDVVVAAHHGSRSSSTPDLVGAVQAQVVLFAAGYRNRWDFPKADVVERWRAAGAKTLSTVDSGAIHVSFDAARGVHLDEYRHERRRYWWAR